MTHEAIQFIIHHGYAAIFILIFLQEIGVPNPVPNELVLLFSGYLTFTGELALPLVLLSAITADLSGSMILYSAFYFFGAYILDHKPRWLPIPTARIAQLSGRISRRGIGSIFLGRLTPFIRGYVSVIAGFLQVKPRLFVPVAVITAIMVCGSYVLIGRSLGPYWSQAAAKVGSAKYVILLVVLVIVWLLSRRANKTAEDEPG